MSTTDKSLLQTILTLLDVLSSHKTEGQSWIHLLSLLCIFTILNQPPTNTSSSAQPANPLQKLLGDLAKGTSQGGGLGSADTLLSLLPLLNSPQTKSKLNPNSIAAMMNVVQSLTGGAAPTPAKTAPPSSESHPASATAAPSPPQPAPSIPSPLEPTPTPPLSPTTPQPQLSKPDPAPTNRYLDWKNSF